MEAAFVLFRFLQYGAASVLFGSALFLLWNNAGGQDRRAMFGSAAIVLALATAGGLVAQTAMLAGSLAEALRWETLSAVVGGMALGKAALVRIAVSLAALVAVLARPRGTPAVVIVPGAVACASFAWSGHAAASEGAAGWLHIASDAVHALAGAAWIGALVMFVPMIRQAVAGSAAAEAACRALERFSSLGVGLVAVLVLTGLLNTWFIAGADPAAAATSTWGWLLAAKIALFLAMLALAAAHRLRLVPALRRAVASADGGAAGLRRLRRTLLAEALLGVAVLATVAWLGTFSPG